MTKMSTSPATVTDLRAIAAHANLTTDWVLDQMEAAATLQAANEAAWAAVTARTVQRPAEYHGRRHRAGHARDDRCG